MKVIWNSFEPAIKVDLGDDPDDYVMELYRENGSQLTVKSTQFSSSGELWIKINGKSAGSDIKPEVLNVGSYAIRVISYELDHILSHEIAVLSHEIKGKSLRIKVDACQ